jgi:hypothetical protein
MAMVRVIRCWSVAKVLFMPCAAFKTSRLFHRAAYAAPLKIPPGGLRRVESHFHTLRFRLALSAFPAATQQPI